MQTCSKCHALTEDESRNCVQCDADLTQWSETAVSLKRMQENSRVAYVRVVVSHDCCPACMQAEGAYAKESVPALPIQGCSHEHGCRCNYQPVLEEVYP